MRQEPRSLVSEEGGREGGGERPFVCVCVLVCACKKHGGRCLERCGEMWCFVKQSWVDV